MTAKKTQPSDPDLTSFLHAEAGGAGFRLARLCGLPLAVDGPAHVQGPAILKTDTGLYQGADFACAGMERAADGLAVTLRVAGTTTEWRSAWRADKATGVVSRRDTLTNAGSAAVVVTRALARLVLPPGRYEVYTQMSRWCHENQGAWQPLRAGLRLTHLPGRTTEGASNRPHMPGCAARSGGWSRPMGWPG